MARDVYLDSLRRIPAFRTLPGRDLVSVGRLVDSLELPAGTQLTANSRELVITLTPTTVLVVDRRAVHRLFEVAPALADTPLDDRIVR